MFKGTNYKKLKSYQFCFEGKVKRLESKTHEDETYVKTSVLPSMKKSPFRVLLEFTPQCDVSRAACICPAGLGSQGKGKCNHIGGVLFALEDFTRRGLQKHPESLSCMHIESFGLGGSMQSEHCSQAPRSNLINKNKIWEEEHLP